MPDHFSQLGRIALVAGCTGAEGEAVAKTDDILTVSEDDKVIWETLPEKSFRDAIAYRGADKIKKFKEEQDQK